MGKKQSNPLNPKNLGIAGGLVWGVSLLLITWISVAKGYAEQALIILADVYPGYDISFGGGILGLVYGFIDGFIGLYVLAWLYNKLEKR